MLQLMGSVVLKMPSGDKVDIGLNLINKYGNLIVP